jgi:hypothetical protein
VAREHHSTPGPAECCQPEAIGGAERALTGDWPLAVGLDGFPTPIGEIPRRMMVVKLADSSLVIFSAIAPGETEMHELDAYGHLPS